MPDVGQSAFAGPTSTGRHKSDDNQTPNFEPGFGFRFRSARYQRLCCAIEVALTEIAAVEHDRKTEAWFQEAELLVRDAKAALNRGAVDSGWTLLNAADRKMIRGKRKSEWLAIATNVEHEISDTKKFPNKHWRIAAIAENVKRIKDTPENPDIPYILQEILFIRDERLGNLHFRDRVTREQILRLCIALCVLTFFAIALSVTSIPQVIDILHGEKGLDPWASLRGWGSILVFGALGATFSALTGLSASKEETKIPEHVMTTWLTWMRPVIGAVSALIVVFAMIGGLSPALNVQTAQVAYFVLATAVAAGFSERLVMKAISAATKSKE